MPQWKREQTRELPPAGVDPADPGSREAVNRRVFGSVLDEDPLDVWNSGAFRTFRDALESPFPDIPCRTCPKRFEVDG